MNKILKAILIVALGTSLSFCTRVDDGYVGIQLSRSSGKIDPQIVTQGWTQTLTKEVIHASTRNLIVDVSSNPIGKEGIAMSTFDTKVNYGIVPNQAPAIYFNEKGQHGYSEDGDFYLLKDYIHKLTKASVSEVVLQYKAMEVNTNREIIERQIKANLIKKLEDNGKLKYVNINEVNVITIDPPQSIKDSVEKIVRTDNEKRSMENEVDKAKLEKEKNEILASSSGKQYTELLNAQANLNFSEAAKIAAGKGQFMPMLVPHGFNGNVTVGK